MALYYRRRTRPIDYAQLGMQLYNIKTQADLAKGRQDLTANEQAMRKKQVDAEYGTVAFPKGPGRPGQPSRAVKVPGLAQRRVEASEGTLALSEEKQKADEKSRLATWNRDMSGPPRLLEMKGVSEKFKSTAPIFNEIMEGVKSDKIKTRYDVFDALSQKKAMGGFKGVQDNLIKDADRLKKQGKLEESQAHMNLALNITKPGFLRTYFNFPKEEMPKQTTSTKLYPTEKGYLPTDEAVGEKPYLKPKQTTDIQEQTHEAKMQMTEANLIGKINEDPDNQGVFDAYGALYNKRNKRNEVVYWDSRSFDEGAETIKLPINAISAGWTPVKIQNKAAQKGVTVEDILLYLGIIE